MNIKGILTVFSNKSFYFYDNRNTLEFFFTFFISLSKCNIQRKMKITGILNSEEEKQYISKHHSDNLASLHCITKKSSAIPTFCTIRN